jgi:hypothetical protein
MLEDYRQMNIDVATATNATYIDLRKKFLNAIKNQNIKAAKGNYIVV